MDGVRGRLEREEAHGESTVAGQPDERDSSWTSCVGYAGEFGRDVRVAR